MVRLINFGTSWAAPVDIERIDTEATDTKVAAVQVQELDVRDPEEKVIVADSRYEDRLFLGIFGVSSIHGTHSTHSNRNRIRRTAEETNG